MTPALRPLGLGDIVDRAATAWRTNWKALFQLTVGFQLLQYTLLKVWELVTNRFFPAVRNAGRLTALIESKGALAAASQLGVGVGSFFVVLSIMSLISSFGAVASAHFLYPRMTGQPAPSVSQALQHAARRGPTTVGLTLLCLAWGLLVLTIALLPALAFSGAGLGLMATGRPWGLGLAIVGFIVGPLAMLGVALWFILRFVVTSQVLAIETEGVWRTFRRSAALVSGSVGPGLAGWVKGRLTVLITIGGLILFIITGIVSVPQLLLHIVYGNALDPLRATPDAVPQAMLVPAEVLQILVGSLFSPLFVALQTVFYIDMRVRREGLDLALSLGASTS